MNWTKAVVPLLEVMGELSPITEAEVHLGAVAARMDQGNQLTFEISNVGVITLERDPLENGVGDVNYTIQAKRLAARQPIIVPVGREYRIEVIKLFVQCKRHLSGK